MKTKVIDNVKELLEKYPPVRDNDWALCIRYLNNYFKWDAVEFIWHNIQPKIVRDRARLQNEFPELQGYKFQDRKKYSKIKAEEYKPRNQEKPEELKKIYWIPDITFNWWLEINTLDTRPFWKKLLNLN